jgi:hypothetical protein
MPFQRLPIAWPFHAGSPFLSDDDAEVLEWREHSMKALAPRWQPGREMR